MNPLFKELAMVLGTIIVREGAAAYRRSKKAPAKKAPPPKKAPPNKAPPRGKRRAR